MELGMIITIPYVAFFATASVQAFWSSSGISSHSSKFGICKMASVNSDERYHCPDEFHCQVIRRSSTQGGGLSYFTYSHFCLTLLRLSSSSRNYKQIRATIRAKPIMHHKRCCKLIHYFVRVLVLAALRSVRYDDEPDLIKEELTDIRQ